MFAVNYTNRSFWQQVVAYAQTQKRLQALIIDDAHLIVLGDVAHYFEAANIMQRSSRGFSRLIESVSY
jgi:hypothetical protein